MPIIRNDTTTEDDEDEDFLPVSSTTFVKQDSDKPTASWEDVSPKMSYEYFPNTLFCLCVQKMLLETK